MAAVATILEVIDYHHAEANRLQVEAQRVDWNNRSRLGQLFREKAIKHDRWANAIQALLDTQPPHAAATPGDDAIVSF